MKTAKNFLFTLVAFLALSAGAFAQALGPEWGATPEEQQQNGLTYNFFKDSFDQNNYDAAVQYMNELIEKAPRSHENIYIRGGNIYKYKINRATSLQERNMYVDSLMYIYDKRLEAFGDHADRGKVYILTTKATDYAAFRALDRDNIRKFYNDAIDATEGKDPQVINAYFNVLKEDYNSDLIETDFLMAEFDRLSAFFADSTAPEMVEGLKTLEQLLIASGAANCDKLEEVYKPQYEADPNNVELMSKIMNMLGRASCSSDFMLLITENLYKAKADPQTGVYLADIFERKGDYEKSLFYWQESIKHETDPTTKAAYILRAATSSLATNNYRQAVSFAREALAIEPENGLAYMIIGQGYGASASSACSDAFERSAIFWLAVDNLQKARALLTGDDSAQTEVLNRSINSFSANFPPNDECFYRGLNSGDSYNVNCGWISGRTIVRVGR